MGKAPINRFRQFILSKPLGGILIVLTINSLNYKTLCPPKRDSFITFLFWRHINDSSVEESHRNENIFVVIAFFIARTKNIYRHTAKIKK